MELMEKLKFLGELHGIDLMGVAGIQAYQSEIQSIGGVIAGKFPRALSIGIVLQKSIVDLLADRDSYENAFQYKTHAYDVINQRLDHFASIVSSIIQKYGYRVMPVPAAERIDSQLFCASVSHKLIARLAGFGWIGKNCLLIHPQYGPGVRYTTVLTDAPFEENREFIKERCGSCDRCTKACPAQAIKGRNFIENEPREMRLDVRKCEAYYQELKSSNRLEVCGMCIYACPYGDKFSNESSS